MPSLGDIANEAKALLQDIKSNTNATKNDTSVIKTNSNTIISQLTQLDTDVKNGFSNIAQGLEVLIALGMQANQLSAENNEQNRAILCTLNNIANTLCEIKHSTDTEIDLQTDISITLQHMDDINELVHSREALDVENRYALEDKMNQCCPPEEEPVRPCFEQCPTPKPTKYTPVKSDWKPSRNDTQGK